MSFFVRVCLSVVICFMMLAMGERLSAGQSATDASPTVATVNGQKITKAELLQALAKDKGRQVLDGLIQIKLIEQEMNRRRITVSEEDVDARLRLMNRARQATGLEPLEDALQKQGQSPASIRRGIRIQLAMEMMAKADLKIPQELGITNLRLDKWYQGLKDKAEIIGRREVLPAGVFAMVNGEAITEAEFNELLWVNSAPEERSLSLDALIKRILVSQALEKKGLVITGADLDAELARLERAYSRSAEYKGLDLDTILRQQGMSRMQLRADPDFAAAVGLRKLIRADLTEEQARKFFAEHEFEYSGGEIRASQIYISAVDTRTGAPKDAKGIEEATKKIADLKRQLDNGADFAVLAQRYSEDRSTAPRGGDLGFVPRFGRLVEPLAKALFSLRKGEVSQVITTPIGYYLLKATDLRPGPKTDFESVKEAVYEDLINTVSDQWFSNLQKSAKIEKMGL